MSFAGGELKKPFSRKKLAFKLEFKKRDIFMIKVRCGRPTERERENTKHD